MTRPEITKLAAWVLGTVCGLAVAALWQAGVPAWLAVPAGVVAAVALTLWLARPRYRGGRRRGGVS